MRQPVKSLGGLLLVVAVAGAQPAQRANSTITSDARFFVDKVYPVLEAAECRMCHNDDGVASATRVRFPPPDAKPDAIQAFGLGLSAVVDRNNPDASLLLRKPTERVAHGGGERIKKGAPEEAALRAWIAYLAKLTPPELNTAISRLKSDTGAATTTAVRRLTHSQYNNTVRDLLGDFTRPADQFPQEDYLHGFTNQAEGQSIPPILAEAYTVASEKLAATAFRHGDTQGLAPCKASSPGDAACRDKFIREFGLKAFRRPLTSKETSGYTRLFTETATQKKDFLAGAQLVVEAMLQSPSFLFHLEDGPTGASRQFGIASRLSYFLWDTMPDAELLRAAAAGEFETPANIRRVALRMMDTPQARRAFEGFVAQWTRFDRVMASVRNARQYADFNPSLLASMTAETKHLFNHLVWGDKNFMEMFSADYTFLSARLAQLYGFDAPSEDFGLVKYPAGSTRAGILGHAGFLTLTGNPTETSPTARGLYVRENFLCQEVPPPPPGVDPTLPAVSAEKPMTTRERLGAHVSNRNCSSCHNLVDPIGFGLEGFDNVGRFREKVTIRTAQLRDAVTNARTESKDIALPLDTKGYIQGIPASEFSNAAGLGRILANDPTCQKCVVKQVFRYATGRHEAKSDQEQLDALYSAFQKSGFRFRELVLALVMSDSFLGKPAQKADLAARVRP
jgi:hypothetical protein